jgi:hypothetical protein
MNTASLPSQSISSSTSVNVTFPTSVSLSCPNATSSSVPLTNFAETTWLSAIFSAAEMSPAPEPYVLTPNGGWFGSVPIQDFREYHDGSEFD